MVDLNSHAGLQALTNRWQAPDVDTFADLDEHRPVVATGTPYDLLAGHRPAWHADAACRDHDVALFFPERGESTEPARELCRACPVARPCLEEALGRSERECPGIWGGTSARERRQLAAGDEL